jgi:hypothetical protein
MWNHAVATWSHAAAIQATQARKMDIRAIALSFRKGRKGGKNREERINGKGKARRINGREGRRIVEHSIILITVKLTSFSLQLRLINV